METVEPEECRHGQRKPSPGRRPADPQAPSLPRRRGSRRRLQSSPIRSDGRGDQAGLGRPSRPCFTRYFGEPEVFHQDIIKSKRVREIFRVANTDDDGKIMPPSHPTMRQLSGAQKWHTDSSYRERPAVGSLLHGIEVSRTGGITCFTNMYAVYEALPERLKAKVQGRRARHDFGMLARELGARQPTEAERKAMPAVWQPMVRIHPVTGRRSLFISPIYNDAVEGMDDAEAVALIRELTEFAEQKQFVYEHRWETDDILMWDNRCTMHYVTPYDPTERRVMHRTTIAGDAEVMAA
jgi:alpha-ketoglutarate-dependent taurine dioxygenase